MEKLKNGIKQGFGAISKPLFCLALFNQNISLKVPQSLCHVGLRHRYLIKNPCIMWGLQAFKQVLPTVCPPYFSCPPTGYCTCFSAEFTANISSISSPSYLSRKSNNDFLVTFRQPNLIERICPELISV